MEFTYHLELTYQDGRVENKVITTPNISETLNQLQRNREPFTHKILMIEDGKG